MFLTLILVLDLLLIASFAFTPYVTRKTELFGVTIPAERSTDPQLMQMRASYRNQLLAGGIVLLAISVTLGLTVGFQSVWAVAVYLVAVFFYLAAAFALYLPKHKRMKSLKHAQGWDTATAPAVVMADTTPAKNDVISPVWLLLFAIVFVLTILGIVAIWPQVPQEVPTHFSAAGAVDSYARKGLDAVLPLLAVQAFLAIIISFCYFLIRASKRQIDAGNPQTSLLQSIRFRHATSVFLIAVGVACQVLMGALQLMMLAGIENIWVIMAPVAVLMVLLLAGTYIMMFRVGQGGSRLREPAQQASHNANVDDDRLWKLGQFYFNPNDPALFVEKRFGIGYTANFARPLTWVFIAALIVLVVGLIVLVAVLAN